jgi:hypothetical protein
MTVSVDLEALAVATPKRFTALIVSSPMAIVNRRSDIDLFGTICPSCSDLNYQERRGIAPELQGN